MASMVLLLPWPTHAGGSLDPTLSLDRTADLIYVRWQQLGDMTHDVSGSHCDGHDLARWRQRQAVDAVSTSGRRIGITWSKHGWHGWHTGRSFAHVNCLASIMRRAKARKGRTLTPRRCKGSTKG